MPAPCSEGHEVTHQVCGVGGGVPGLSVTALTSSGASMAGEMAIQFGHLCVLRCPRPLRQWLMR